MSWNVDVQNAPSKAEAERLLESAEGTKYMPDEVLALCKRAIKLIPAFGKDKDAPATGYNITCSGHMSEEPGLLGTSFFNIRASNNFVTGGPMGVPEDEERAPTAPEAA